MNGFVRLVSIMLLSTVFGIVFLCYCAGLYYHGENASWSHWRVDQWIVNWLLDWVYEGEDKDENESFEG